jgi:hypothetical protein
MITEFTFTQEHEGFEKDQVITFSPICNFIVGDHDVGKTDVLNILRDKFDIRSVSLYDDEYFLNLENEIDYIEYTKRIPYALSILKSFLISPITDEYFIESITKVKPSNREVTNFRNLLELCNSLILSRPKSTVILDRFNPYISENLLPNLMANILLFCKEFELQLIIVTHSSQIVISCFPHIIDCNVMLHRLRLFDTGSFINTYKSQVLSDVIDLGLGRGIFE